MNVQADYVFFNGNVVTMDEEAHLFDSLAVKGNKILAVGPRSELDNYIRDSKKSIDLRGRSLLPGFIEAHNHLIGYGAGKLHVDCRGMRSIKDIQEALHQRAGETPTGEWVIGRNYDHTRLSEQRHPNRWDLDEAVPNHPVLLIRVCEHMSVVNSRTLELLAIDKNTPDPHGGKIDRQNGEPTGLLLELAQVPVKTMVKETVASNKKAVRLAMDEYIRYGITSSHDAEGAFQEQVRAYLETQDQLDLRVYFMVRVRGEEWILGYKFLETGLITGFGNEKLRLGSFKMSLDGAGSGGTAAMREPYPGTQNYGMLHMTPQEADALVLKAHEAGFQLAIHAIGDRGVEIAVDSIEQALEKVPRENHRHRIEHCSFQDEPLLERIRALKILPVSNPSFLYYLGDAYLKYFGEERLKYALPLRSYMDLGIRVAAGSDCPVTPANPLMGIYSAVTRKTDSGKVLAPEQRIDILEAIRLFTTNGAYASFEEDIKGSLEPGKLADFVVLSDDILQVDPEKLPDIKVDYTVCDGRIVYSSEKGG